MYLTIKPFLVLAAMGLAFTYFFLKAKTLVDLARAVSNPGPQRWNNVPARLGWFFKDVLGQSSVRRKLGPGIAHTMIFWGFIVITIGTLEMMVEGVIHGLNLSVFGQSVWSGYQFIADIMIVGVLLGVAFGFFRRLVLRPKYLHSGPEAYAILTLTASLMFALLFMNAFRVGGDAAMASTFPVSSVLARMFFGGGLSPEMAFFGQEIFYWAHLLLVLGFLAYVPNSKHLHILAAAPNVFLKHLGTPKPMETTNLEDENATSFGLSKVSELNWKKTLDLYACTECGRCEEACPASMTGKPLSPYKVVHDMKIELLRQKDLVLNKKPDEIPHIVREETGITEDVMWSCTSCRACEEACPVYIEQTNLIFETRKSLVLMEARFPPELQSVFRNMENNFTPWAFGHDTRADWCRDLDVKQMADHPTAEVLYYVGCAGSFDDRAKKVATAIVSLLKKANVDFAILGKEEKCNGDPARRAGNEYLAQMLIKENVETLNKYKPRKILTGCPHCFNTLKNEYPAFGAQYDVVHHTTFLSDLIKEGKLKPQKGAGGEITFHDSCYLGRWNDIYSDPREILAAIPELNIKEMPRTKNKGLCCGAGGTRMFMEETIGKRINVERTEEALQTLGCGSGGASTAGAGGKTIAAACPFCSTMLTDGVKTKDAVDQVQVKDVAELLDAATPATTG
jgi:Fe-S oxidoreductase